MILYLVLVQIAIPIVLLFVLFGRIPLPQDSATLVAIANYALISAISCMITIVPGRRAFLRSIVLYNFVFMGVVPLVHQYHPTAHEFYTPVSKDTEVYAMLSLIASNLTMLLGYYFATRARWRIPSFGMGWMVPISGSPPLGSYIGWFGLGLSFLGIILIGGPQVLLVSRSEFSDSLESEGNIAVAIIKALIGAPIAVSTIVMMARLLRYPERRTTSAVLGFLVLFAVNLLANNPLYTPRFWCFTIFGGLLVCFLYFQAPESLRWYPALGTMFLLLVVPFADVYRRSTEASLGERIATSQGLVSEVVDKGDLGTYFKYLSVIRMTQRRGMDFGRQLSGACLFFIPRAIWKSKPVTTGTLVAEEFGYFHPRISTPLISEFYCGFGMAGALIGMLLFGVLAGAADNVLMEGGEYAEAITLLLLYAVPFTLMLMRGALLIAVARFSYFAFFYFMTLLFPSWFGGGRRVEVQLLE